MALCQLATITFLLNFIIQFIPVEHYVNFIIYKNYRYTPHDAVANANVIKGNVYPPILQIRDPMNGPDINPSEEEV